MTDNYDSDSLPQVSQPVTSDIVIPNVIHNNDFWDNDYHVTFLFSHSSYLKTNARVLTLFVLYIAHFIQKYTIGNYLIEQFSPIIETGSFMWHLFQTISAVEWDYFKISLQANVPSLVEVMRILYSPNLPQELAPDMEMTVDEPPVVEEALFTTYYI